MFKKVDHVWRHFWRLSATKPPSMQPPESLFHEAKFVLQHATDLVRSDKIHEAAVFLLNYG